MAQNKPGNRPLRIVILSGLAIIAIIALWLFLPVPKLLFDTTYATILESADGQLMGARIATDGHWRFPAPDSVPVRFEKCLLQFEDQYFYRHPGINPVSLFRAFLQNIKTGRVVSGGSTLTMQVARMARPDKKRNLFNKAAEMIWSLSIELRYSKKEILNLYAAHAPFGGNVVGIEAASWRYFHRPPHRLSWAESATLAVLPNAPSLIFPGKNDSLLLIKRNRLLDKLLDAHIIDALTCGLAKSEPLPRQLYRLPDECYHLLETIRRGKPGMRIKTTLDLHLQQLVNGALIRHHRQLSRNQINNAAAVIADIRTGRVLAYAGNVPVLADDRNGSHVDIIRSPRSSGSILKPFLFAAMIDKGMLAPRQLISDIPTRFGGFTPLNFSREYDGVVHADDALARSLNVPAVKMLQQYGVEPFNHLLKNMGMTTLTKPAGHYGLSLILGGAETTLWDLAGMYASLARIVVNYQEKDGFYPLKPFCPLIWEDGKKPDEGPETTQPLLHAASAWLTLKTLQKVARPEEETGWEDFAGIRHISWKTGTSFGFRDGWSVGVTSDYLVGVWIGNASGEGRPGLTGTTTAAPLMFEIFGMLPVSAPFARPNDEMAPTAFCRQSGYRPSSFCKDIDTLWVPKWIQTGQCPYHQVIHLDQEGRNRVTGDCYAVSSMQHRNWFVLPPVEEFYYRRKNPAYVPLPPFRSGCQASGPVMELIYPGEIDRIFIPRQLDGTQGEVIFELAHRNPQTEVFWFIDQEFAGSTIQYHQLSVRPDPGWHNLTVTDQHGNHLKKRFFVDGTDNEPR